MLTEKEAKLFEIIIETYSFEGKYPSYSYLANKMGYKSKRSISLLIDSLVEKKHLKKSTDSGYKIATSIKGLEFEETIEVNLVGDIACGQAIFAEENVEATYAISTKLAPRGNNYFLLRAIGDSMNNPPDGKEAIESGDLVLIQVQNHAENGQWVVALIDNDATIKEFQRNKDHVLLIPHSTNESHKTIILSNNIRIQGVVKNVLKGVDFLIS